jgi:acyl-coenzyme A synthetase/AMP-(fatty) acid ligase
MYGPTETTIWSTARRLERNEGATRDAIEPIGRPIANTQAYVLDAELRPLPIGVQGELYIGGDGLAAGYRNLPELTAQRFLPHPFSGDRSLRLYRTGDLARYRENGDIEYHGRTDHQIKLRGFRIEAGETEAVLNTHPGIRQAVVDARKHAAGEKRLIARYVGLGARCRRPSCDHIRRKLPDYMIPALFACVAEVPMTQR